MKKILSTLLVTMLMVALAVPCAFARGGGHSRSGSVSVHGYTKKNGTYVAPHHRSHADKSKGNNWSTKGNFNPYTGKAGTKNPY